MEKNQIQDQLKILDALNDDIRLNILILLQMYEELSLSELTEKIPKSKPTIHRHIQYLIEIDLVEESKEEFVRGNIPAKFYKLNGNLMEKIPIINMTLIEKISEDEMIDLIKNHNFIHMFNQLLEFFKTCLANFQRYFDSIEKTKSYGEIYNLIKNEDFGILFNFLTPNTLKLIKKMNKISNKQEKDGIDIEKMQGNLLESMKNSKNGFEYFQFSILMPLKRIFEQDSNQEN